ncbi:MAG: DUF4981 domain-containing protein, partial [Bacteroides sp.]|nr:DUF4981 domain-containing protein [Bacteroides sp.]
EDGSFCLNGLVFPDRTIHPGLWEVKRAYQYVGFETVALRSDLLMLRNKYDFISLEGFDILWEMLENGSVVNSGAIESPNAGPGETLALALDLDPGEMKPGKEYHLNVKAVTRNGTALVSAGHVVASEQFSLTPPLDGSAVQEEFMAVGSDEVSIDESGEKVVISIKDGTMVFDRRSGYLELYSMEGLDLLTGGPFPNFWRAPTENDFGNNMPLRSSLWRYFGEDLELQSIVPVKTDQIAMLQTEYIHPENGSTYRVSYTVNNEGEILVDVQFNPGSDRFPVMPRFGMSLELSDEFDHVAYYGRGPHENYIDRNHSSGVGLYESTVEEQYVPYITNGENGNKTETRWISLSNNEGRGILIKGLPLFDFSALPYSQSSLNREVRDGAHTTDLELSGKVYLNVDWKQMGVGGDDSWGARTHTSYLLSPEPLKYSFIIVPLHRY